MRLSVFCALLAAACAGTQDGGADKTGGTGKTRRPTRIVLNTYQGVAGVFIMENLAGRDLTELRSKRLEPGHPPVAYVEDSVMDELLRIFRKLDYDKHAQARPPDPRKFGAVSELTVVRVGRDTRTILKKQPTGRMLTREEAASLKSYVECKRNFLALYNTYRPEMQATTSGSFGVKRASKGE